MTEQRKYIQVEGGKVHLYKLDQKFGNLMYGIVRCGIEYRPHEAITAAQFRHTNKDDLCKKCFPEVKE